jgi:uncharacterized protein (DUF952 family)
MPLLHLCRSEEWERALATGDYRAASLESEGFIHCSTLEQIVATAQRHRAGQQGLLLLIIDPDRVGPEIRYEEAKNGEAYPHIYGPLNLDAVTSTQPFPLQPDGSFLQPFL